MGHWVQAGVPSRSNAPKSRLDVVAPVKASVGLPGVRVHDLHGRLRSDVSDAGAARPGMAGEIWADAVGIIPAVPPSPFQVLRAAALAEPVVRLRDHLANALIRYGELLHVETP